MQRFFGFEQYIRAGAQKTIEIIRDLDIVDSLEKGCRNKHFVDLQQLQASLEKQWGVF